MIRPVALTAALLLMWSASAASSGVAEDAAEASAELQQAVAALQAAEGAKAGCPVSKAVASVPLSTLDAALA